MVAGREITALQVNACFIPGAHEYQVDYNMLLELGEFYKDRSEDHSMLKDRPACCCACRVRCRICCYWASERCCVLAGTPLFKFLLACKAPANLVQDCL
jgi:hypothetical protein